MKLLVAGGAGFIGSNFVRFALKRWPECTTIVLDALTYAGNKANLHDVWDDPRFTFIQGDICDPDTVRASMSGCSQVINFAAETHVDRSILDASAFLRTDIEGTRILLEAVRDTPGIERYLQVSTDEVYGEIDPPRRATEEFPLRPRSPYAASKAGGDLMVGAYFATYNLPVLITRGANTYGPYQFPEKLIPLFVTNALDGLSLPVYGDGRQVRDWLHVEDHCEALAIVLEHGLCGHTYNVGAGSEQPNLAVIEGIVALTRCDPSLVEHVPDRPGHDRRYALDTAKIRALGWQPGISFEHGLASTVRWYSDHSSWWRPLKDGEYHDYYRRQYESRLAAGHR